MFRLHLLTAIVISAGTTALLTGCAVTRIDVDVYKGPLANHEDVQVEQMAVTAIAAKEMLVDLRDRLEWPSVEAERSQAIEDGWYRRGYVRDPRLSNPRAEFDEDQWFSEPQAVRVNHILSLYEDELDDTDSQLASYVADGLRALQDYEAAWAVFVPGHDQDALDADAKRWESHRKAFHPQLRGDEPQHPLLAALPEWQRAAAKRQLDLLVQAYEEFLCPGPDHHRREIAILAKHENIRRLIREAGHLHEDAGRFAVGGIDMGDFIRDGDLHLTHANERLHVLRQRRVIESHAELLFPDEQTAAREEFVKHVERMVEAYFASREAMARLFHAVMNITILHDILDPAPTEAKRRKMVESTARFVASAVDPVALTFVIESDPEGVDPATKIVRDRLMGLPAVSLDPDVERIEKAAESAQDVREEIRKEFMEDPTQMATALLLVHAWYRTATRDAVENLRVPVHSERARAYGLTRGPYPADFHLLFNERVTGIMTRREMAKPPNVLELLERSGRMQSNLREEETRRVRQAEQRRFLRASHDFRARVRNHLSPVLVFEEFSRMRVRTIGPFARGRLPEGLNQLIQDYLEAAHRHRTDAEETLRARRRLVDGLVHFAEKLLFLANHDSLLEEERSRLMQHAAERLSLGLIKEKEAEVVNIYADPRQYVRVLQATGNSILIHADELQIRDAHRQRGKEQAKIEFAALDRGQRRTARGVVDDLGDVLDQRRDEANEAGQREEEARLDHAVTKLEGIDDQVVRHFADERGLPTRQEVHLVIEGVFVEEMAKLEGEEERASWLEAIREVRRHRPIDLGGIRQIPLREGETQRDVLDRLIAVLRNEHIQLVRQYGKDSEPVQRVEAAMESAHDHRSGMIYLRPAGAYLRSSFVATDLQDDPGLRWRNLLAEHGTRAIPFAPQIGDLLNSRQRRDAQIVAELDKQYWHPINQVRVAGGGNTNYVMAKDDIGNWYVKNYSADASEVYNSAVNLLQYATGGGAEPIEAGRLGATPDDAAPPAEDAGVRQLLDWHSGRFAARSEAQAEAARVLVQDDDDGLTQKIAAVLEIRFQDDEDFLEELERGRRVAEQQHLSDLRGEDDDPSGIHSDEPSVVVATAANALTKTAQAWRAEIQKTGHADKDAADDIVTSMTRDKLLTLVTQRRAAIAEFERAARVLGVTGD